MASAVTKAPSILFLGPLRDAIRRFEFTAMGYNKLGLYSHDALRDTPVVSEAIRRLPPKIYDDRNFRIARAFRLSSSHTVLPKEMWISYEEDQEKGFYMKELMEQVERELDERHSWESK